MKKFFLFFIFIFIIKLSFGFIKPNDSTQYIKSNKKIGLMLLPNILTLNHPNYGYLGLTINPSFSYFIINNIEASFSIISINMKTIQYTESSKLNIFQLNPYIRYYFIKSRFFFEMSYFYGITTEKDTHNKTTNEFTNNLGWGTGYNQTIKKHFGKLNNKLSWEFSIKGIIPNKSYNNKHFNYYRRISLYYHF